MSSHSPHKLDGEVMPAKFRRHWLNGVLRRVVEFSPVVVGLRHGLSFPECVSKRVSR